MVSSRVVVAGLAAVGLVGVAGCGGSSSETAGSSVPMITPSSKASSPSSSASASPSSSGTAAGAPGVPEAARQHTEAGAKAFATYYFEAINAAYRQPVKDATVHLYQKSCLACGDFNTEINDLTQRSQHYDGDQVSPSVSRANQANDTPHVFVTLQQHAVHLVSESGKIVKTEPTMTAHAVLILDWTTNGWRVQDIQNEEV